MNENDVVDEKDQEKPSISPKPWHRCKWVRIIGMLLILMVYYLFYRPIEVTREPWQVLDPGRPVAPSLKFEVVQEGGGAVVEVGDLIQISRWRGSIDDKKIEQRDDDWWIWVGFRTEEETPFYGMNPRMVSALVGQKEGGG
ncbi:hypothetical protein AGMMS50256_35770 [Betaproteobacteria bacterium]|nr:hypothetical protein AGMMS50256_35770 [Betaproteobacteria bacterium]